jgi:hypothetical protein
VLALKFEMLAMHGAVLKQPMQLQALEQDPTWRCVAMKAPTPTTTMNQLRKLWARIRARPGVTGSTPSGIIHAAPTPHQSTSS